MPALLGDRGFEFVDAAGHPAAQRRRGVVGFEVEQLAVQPAFEVGDLCFDFARNNGCENMTGMAVIHNNTTMSPTKLEMLSRWLPEQPWFIGSPTPKLSKVGGFRLDDPAGEVGIEFMFVTDESSSPSLAPPMTYHVPMTYRGAPLPGAERALVGTGQHGVLGKRWIYDATHDPVAVAQLIALVQGDAEPQHQSRSHTPDHSVTSSSQLPKLAQISVTSTVNADPRHTTISLLGTEPSGESIDLAVHILRMLDADSVAESAAKMAGGLAGYVEAEWRKPDGTPARGRVVLCGRR